MEKRAECDACPSVTVVEIAGCPLVQLLKTAAGSVVPLLLETAAYLLVPIVVLASGLILVFAFPGFLKIFRFRLAAFTFKNPYTLTLRGRNYYRHIP
jgi:hypothetical protein